MKELTGRHVLLMFVAGFGVIIAVNLVLAFSAVRTFPGLEVRNSYVASQKFDADRAAQEALDWTSALEYDGRMLTLSIRDASGPVEPRLTSAILGRATHVGEDHAPAFTWNGEAFTAGDTLAPGLWNLRLVALALDGTEYRRRLELRVDP